MSDHAIPVADLTALCSAAVRGLDAILSRARRGALALVVRDGTVDPAALETHQTTAHGLAWLATYAQALTQLKDWADRLGRANRLGELERLILQAGFGEYLNQIFGGIAMSQSEFIRLGDFGIDQAEAAGLESEAIGRLRRDGASDGVRRRIAELVIQDGDAGEPGLEDETLDLVRDQFRRFSEEQVAPHAQDWHIEDVLIPMEVVETMAELGVFGLTIPEDFGGLGLGKTAMCVVTEELSRASLAVGSLGTRSEIAAELIRLGGTEEQKRHYLPKLATGEILPTAVFTEPNAGSDLGALRTRAVLAEGAYRVTGAKTWITHAARSDLMTLLVRTNPDSRDWRGLSMLLAEKPRGTDDVPFPAPGMTGSEIRVLGYRGMKEYELGFDGFAVPAANLLGGSEGQGFKQLMGTFESARIQTAARAVGVAQSALDAAVRYCGERVQFGKPLSAFPRVYGKIAWMAVETMIARQLTYFAAREKDGERRCDMEAGMAKLLAARVAWSNADSALQIHGGNGYAEEYAISRILCDARVLNIFEGAGEIQAQVIARGLLGGRN